MMLLEMKLETEWMKEKRQGEIMGKGENDRNGYRGSRMWKN